MFKPYLVDEVTDYLSRVDTVIVDNVVVYERPAKQTKPVHVLARNLGHLVVAAPEFVPEFELAAPYVPKRTMPINLQGQLSARNKD